MFVAQVLNPAEAPFVIAIMALAIFLVGSALAHSAKWIFDTVFHSLFLVASAIPFGVGRRIRNALEGVGQRASNALGHWAAQSDQKVGHFFWRIAHTIEGCLELIGALVIVTGLLVEYVTEKYALPKIQAGLKHIGGTVTVVNKTYPRIVKEVKLTKKQMAGIIAAAISGVKIAQHTAAHTAGQVATLPVKVGVTAKQMRRMGARVHRLEKAIFGVAAVATLDLTLRRAGMHWLRCPSLNRLGRKIGCNGFANLEAFLSPAVEALIVLDLCRFALAAQGVARTIVPQLGPVLLVENAVCLGGGGSLPSAHDSPSVRTSITLPTAHD